MAPSPKVNAGLPAHELDTLVTKCKHQGYRQDIHSEDDNAEPLEFVRGDHVEGASHLDMLFAHLICRTDRVTFNMNIQSTDCSANTRIFIECRS